MLQAVKEPLTTVYSFEKVGKVCLHAVVQFNTQRLHATHIQLLI